MKIPSCVFNYLHFFLVLHFDKKASTLNINLICEHESQKTARQRSLQGFSHYSFMPSITCGHWEGGMSSPRSCLSWYEFGAVRNLLGVLIENVRKPLWKNAASVVAGRTSWNNVLNRCVKLHSLYNQQSCFIKNVVIFHIV